MEPINSTSVRDLVMRERRLAVSEREWRHRLRGYGFAIRDSEEGRVVTSLVRGGDICVLAGAAA
ncbi:MAG: hypothetical protein Kow0058_08650 [Roseovarius sp.]